MDGGYVKKAKSHAKPQRSRRQPINIEN